jgi:hypothetical protein
MSASLPTIVQGWAKYGNGQLNAPGRLPSRVRACALAQIWAAMHG